MTNERRRELKELVMSLMGVGIKTDDCYGLEECIDKAYEADKYKWHDLRKNPEDLPENGEWCCVYLDEVFAEEWVADDFHYAIGKYGYHFAKEKLKHVIAWRYIEPFEEDKE